MNDPVMPTPCPNTSPWCVALVGAIVSLLCLALYLGVEARGRMEFITQPAQQWGVPPSLAARGCEPLYLDPRESGWDGQFYFRMANDPLGRGDSPPHIDSPSYRYQRVGMSATAWLLAHVFLQDWVSPTMFYLTSLLALFGATWALAAYFRQAGASPWLALIWSLGLGTQLTLLNGLPDGFAEAMLVLGVLSLARPRPNALLYAITMSLGVLSREVYIVAAGLIFGLHVLRLVQGDASLLVSKSIVTEAGGWRSLLVARLRALFGPGRTLHSLGQIGGVGLPLLIFGAWQLYLRFHFGRAPTEQAGGVLAPFFKEFIRFFQGSWNGNHPVFGQSLPMAQRELGMLTVFLVILLLYCVTVVVLLLRNRDLRKPAVLILAFLPVIALYCFFGPVVMMHYSGYLKAANIVLFLVPFALISLPFSKTGWRTILLATATVCSIAGFGQFFYDKILVGSLHLGRPATLYENTRYHSGSKATETQAPLSSFASTVRIVGNSSFYGNELFRELRHIPEIRIFSVEVTNQGAEPYRIAEGVGAVRLSYNWFAADGTTVVKDGLRTYFQTPLPPMETRRVSLYVEYPDQPGTYLLRLSLVQEGVTWFYLQGTGFADYRVTIR